jgi:hypothetical protein
MWKETDTLIVERVDWRYVAANEKAYRSDVTAPIPIGIGQIEVMCKKCGNEWIATSGIVAGPSTFHEVIGDLLLLCSECGMQHVIPESIICENE